ncbi:hypothetical protein IWQ51_003931 [Labrenzia sp. EL_142]|nr:hypothetical protein [Labrenzia sp. EL_142]
MIDIRSVLFQRHEPRRMLPMPAWKQLHGVHFGSCCSNPADGRTKVEHGDPAGRNIHALLTVGRAGGFLANKFHLLRKRGRLVVSRRILRFPQ